MHGGAPGPLLAVAAVVDDRHCRGSARHGAGRLEPVASPERLYAGVPSCCGHERNARRRLGRPMRERRPPAAGSHAQHVVERRREGIRAKRGEVLIGERHPHDEVVAPVRMAAVDARRLEGFCPAWTTKSWPCQGRQRRYAAAASTRVGVLDAQFADGRNAGRRPPFAEESHPRQPQRVALIVGVVEERRRIGRSDGGRELAADVQRPACCRTADRRPGRRPPRARPARTPVRRGSVDTPAQTSLFDLTSDERGLLNRCGRHVQLPRALPNAGVACADSTRPSLS